jgi:hypothetical protein
MSLEKWLEYGWLKREASSPDEIQGLLSIEERVMTRSNWMCTLSTKAKRLWFGSVCAT